MAFGYLASVLKQGTSAGSGDSGAIVTTGVNLFVAVVCDYNQVGAVTPTDKISGVASGNVWTALTPKLDDVSGRLTIWYCYNPAVGSSHTFAANGSGTFASIAVAAFSGCASSPVDQQNGAVSGLSSVPSLATGSITPTQPNELLIYAIGDNAPKTGTASVSVGTILQQAALQAGVSFANSIAYEIQTTATTRNPSFTFGSTTDAAAVIASFKAAGGVTVSAPAGILTLVGAGAAQAGKSASVAVGILLLTGAAIGARAGKSAATAVGVLLLAGATITAIFATATVSIAAGVLRLAGAAVTTAAGKGAAVAVGALRLVSTGIGASRSGLRLIRNAFAKLWIGLGF